MFDGSLVFAPINRHRGLSHQFFPGLSHQFFPGLSHQFFPGLSQQFFPGLSHSGTGVPAWKRPEGIDLWTVLA